MKKIFITGAGKRLGRAIALYFAENDYFVIANYRKDIKSINNMKKLAKLVGKNIYSYPANVTSEIQVKRMFSVVEKKYGKIDILINNVGGFIEKPLMKIGKKEFKEVLENNLLSAFLCSKYGSQIMNNKGSIINIGFHSIFVEKPYPNILPYAIAKNGVHLITKTFANELAKRKIRVNTVSPGILFNDKSSRKKDDIPLGRPGDYNDIINIIEFLISKKASYITGENINVDGGL